MIETRMEEMSKHLKFIVFLGMYLPSLAAGQPTIPRHDTADVYIKERQFKLSGVSLGSSIRSAERVFGKPDSVASAEGVYADTGRTYYFEGVEVCVDGNQVWTIRCKNPKHRTANGIRVGASIARVFQTYGVTSKQPADKGYRVSYIVWPPSGAYLAFDIIDGKVAQIVLDGEP